MHRFRRVVALALATASIGAMTALSAPAATASGMTARPVCGVPAAGHAGCFALTVTGSRHLSAFDGPAGYHPADLLSAYKLNAKKGKGQTIGIVDAYDNPNAESDLAVYRSAFNLPACTTANHCFRKVNQTGGSTPPVGNVSWGAEISLDVDMASAICPKCKILLVEANTNGFADLGTAVNEAATLGATEISNSYGGNEASDEATDASYYDHPGIPITVSSGDSAYPPGAQVPAVFPTVTAVGGTSLVAASNARGWKESVWLTNPTEGAGSGCSQFVAKPAWQTDTGCAGRTVADVAAVADPNTGVTGYDSYGYSGFLVFGGTSAAAPIIAGVYALAGNGATVNDASRAYANPTKLFDVTKGNNGTCGGSYLCTAKKGYDGPTGLGTPKGTLAF